MIPTPLKLPHTVEYHFIKIVDRVSERALDVKELKASPTI